LGSPVKEPSFQVPLIGLLQRDIPHSWSRLSFIFQSPWYRSPFYVPQRSPCGERCPSPKPSFTHSPGSAVKEPPLQVPLIGLLQREIPHSWSPLSFIFQSPWYRSPFYDPQRSPCGERCPSPKPSFTHPPGSAVKEPPLQVPLAELPQRETFVK